MPKIFGTNIAGILIATIVMYMLGFLWYAAIFDAQWTELTGITEEIGQENMDKMGAMFFVWGLLIALGQVLGLSYVFNHVGANKLLTCVKICVIIAFLFALPLRAYGALYEMEPAKLLTINFAYSLVGYGLIGAILSFFRGKDTISP